MKRVRVAGVIPMDGGIALMHRKDVKKRDDFQEYYTFPGGGLEEGETLEECAIREVKEEFGINVKVIRKLYELENDDLNMKEYDEFEYLRKTKGRLVTDKFILEEEK